MEVAWLEGQPVVNVKAHDQMSMQQQQGRRPIVANLQCLVSQP